VAGDRRKGREVVGGEVQRRPAAVAAAASSGGRGGSVNDVVEAKFVATSELGRFTVV
jgi:hypothetical protein